MGLIATICETSANGRSNAHFLKDLVFIEIRDFAPFIVETPIP
jgi:hypothetical protein